MKNLMGTFLAGCVWLGLAASSLADDAFDARDLIDRGVEAVGGADNLARFQAFTCDVKGVYHGFGLEITYTGTWAVQPPARMRTSVEGHLKGQKFTRLLVIDGDKGWVGLNDFVEEMDPETLAEEKKRFFANWVASLAPLKNDHFELSPLPQTKNGKRVFLGVKVKHEGASDVKLFFDKQTMLLDHNETRIREPLSGKEITQEVFFGDYREVQGLKRAMKIAVKWDGKKYAEGELTNFKFHEKLENERFGKPR